MFGKQWLLWLAGAVLTSGAAAAHAQIIMDTVRVDDVGNAADPTTGNLYGAVNYRYWIGKYEVTNAQYVEFLNAKAQSDTYALYNLSMGSDARGGITRSGSSPNYTYSVKSGYENMPVVFVSWYDTVRFANWLTNGQGSGDTESGSYAISGGGANSGSVAVPSAATRATWAAGNGWHWLLPSEDEWYKAAYFQPSSKGGDSDNYWLYPMRTNTEPDSDQPPGSQSPLPSNTGNFIKDDGLVNNYNDGFAVTGSPSYSSSQNYLTEKGAYTQSLSYYGTFDQGGNVWEWDEALTGGSYRGVRGGSWNNDVTYLAASSRLGNPANEYFHLGFRVSVVPEPASIVMLLMSGLVVLLMRRRSHA